MNREIIHDKLQLIFQDIFDDSAIYLQDSTTAADIEDWDSLMQINLIVAIEEEFQIKFKLSDVEKLRNVGEMIDAIAGKICP